MKGYLVIFVIFSFVCCKSQVMIKICDHEPFIEFALSDSMNNSNEKVNYKKDFFLALDSGQFELAQLILARQAALRKGDIPGDVDFLVNPGNKENGYMLFRLSQALGNVYEYKLHNKLIALTSPYFIASDSASCFYKLMDIESDFLMFYSFTDSSSKYQKLKKFSEYINSYPNSNRIKYLFARINFDLGLYEIAKPIFFDLLNRQYNVRPIINLFFEYYSKNNKDSLGFFSNKLSSLFPGVCNLGKLELFSLRAQEDSLIKECNTCFFGGQMTDSIKAQVLILKYSLTKRNFRKVHELYELYKRNNSIDFDFSDFKIWELGEYYDTVLRSLFLQKKFKEMYFFLIKEVSLNKKVVIENDSDFYELIKSYYSEYYPKQSNGFELFFKNNFGWVRSQFKA